MINSTVRFLILLTSVTCCTVTEASELKVQPVFTRSSEAKYSLEGPVNDYIQAVTEHWLLRAPRDNPAMLEMFADRDQQPYRNLLPWSGEFAGKYLTCLTQMLPLTENQHITDSGSEFVKKFIALQAPDGYLGPFPKKFRLTGKTINGKRTWDAWGHYHAMMGLILWHDRTGDKDALASASRIGDLLCDKFLKSGVALSSTGSTEMNQAVVHSLALLYQRTEQKKYLELAEEIVQDFAAPNAGDFLQAGLRGDEFFQTRKPRWESLHPLMGLAELYWITGNEDYRKVFEHFWWSIVKLDRHNNGGFSSGERAHGNPYHPGAIETCCTVAWMAMSTEMLKMTGDSRVADELELSTLNQAIAMHSPTGKWCTYNTPMDGQRIPSTVDIAFQIRPGSKELNCCSVNAARSFGMIADWALMRHKQGLVLNWYGPSSIKTRVKNIPVVIKQHTQYPTTGEIAIVIETAQPVEFELKLRIPHWSANSKVTVNGEEVVAKAGTYASITRSWKTGDKINVHLDMSLRHWTGEQQYAGKISLYRGPLLLAYEETFDSSLDYSEEWKAFGHFRSTNKVGAQITYTFEGDEVEWHGFFFDDAGKTRVLIDNKEVDIVDQYGPVRDVPFAWKREGLGEGKHVLRLEVLGENNAKSSNSWVNVREIKATANIPLFDVKQLSSNEVAKLAETGFVLLNMVDSLGKNIQLRDYASVGQGGAMYYSWLPAKEVKVTPFTKNNPSRTSKSATQ